MKLLAIQQMEKELQSFVESKVLENYYLSQHRLRRNDDTEQE